MFTFKKNRPGKERFSLGLDIGTHTIKVARLKFGAEQPQLSGFDLQPAQLDLAQAFSKAGLSQNNGDYVNIGVCGPATIIRYVNFPKMSNQELKQALKFEAQKNIPFSVDEVNLDGYILKGDLPENKMLVLLAAVKKEFLSQRLKAIEGAGLRVNLADMDSLALVNAFCFNYAEDESMKNKAIALLNIGASITNLNIVDNCLPRLSRDINIAGNSFTQKIADSLGIDFKAADNLKASFDDSKKDEKLIAAIEAVASGLAAELRTSFDFYESRSASVVARIFLSGGSSNLRGIKEALANLLGIEVGYFDPFRKIGISAEVDPEKLKAASGQLAVAVGLALRG